MLSRFDLYRICSLTLRTETKVEVVEKNSKNLCWFKKNKLPLQPQIKREQLFI